MAKAESLDFEFLSLDPVHYSVLVEENTDCGHVVLIVLRDDRRFRILTCEKNKPQLLFTLDETKQLTWHGREA